MNFEAKKSRNFRSGDEKNVQPLIIYVSHAGIINGNIKKLSLRTIGTKKYFPPDRPFCNFWILRLSRDVPKLQKDRRSPDYEALKLGKGCSSYFSTRSFFADILII